MADKMQDGQSLSWHLYPPFPWKGATRKRVYAHLSTPTFDKPGVLVDETGFTAEIRSDGEVYDLIEQIIRDKARVVYTPRIDLGEGRKSILLRASLDKHAEVIYHPKGGIRGIRFKHRSSRLRAGALLVDNIWTNEFEENSRDWIECIRRTAKILDCGDYDTPGSLGEATLSKFWTENGLRRIWRLPEDLSDMFDIYSVGGRAEILGQGNMVYPNSCEIDLSSAYPTAVARGIPAGSIVYHGRDCDWKDREAAYGLWRITVHDDIPFSPIPVRNWQSKGSPIGWKLDSGWEFEYAGWDDEIKALVSTGSASAEFIRGWSWLRLSSFLAPWIDQLKSMRVKADENGEPTIAKQIKQVMNAAIGRWGMSNDQWTVVPDPIAKIEMGDLPIEFGRGTTGMEYNGWLTGIWVRPVADRARKTMPYHWSSYVKMAVRMELWRKALEEMSRGSTVLSLNFDSILMSDRPQGSNDMDVAAAQADHPWDWKIARTGEAQVPYNRAVIFQEEGGVITTKLPGMSGDDRNSVVRQFLKKAGGA